MANQYRPNTPLREWRTSHGYTQAEIAAQIGFDERSVLRWETGQSKPGPYARHQLATLTGLPLLVLMAAYAPLPVSDEEPTQAPPHKEKPHRGEPLDPLAEDTEVSAPRVTHPTWASHAAARPAGQGADLLVAGSLTIASLLLTVLALGACQMPVPQLIWLTLLVGTLALLSQWAIWWLAHHHRDQQD